jgi:hypothetical protein
VKKLLILGLLLASTSVFTKENDLQLKCTKLKADMHNVFGTRCENREVVCYFISGSSQCMLKIQRTLIQKVLNLEEK